MVRRIFLLTILTLLLTLPPATAAHPLDEYYQATYITVAPNRINLTIELYPSVLIAPQILSLIDSDSDDTLTPAEQEAYVRLFTNDLTFEIDGAPTPLQATELEFPSVLDIRSGGGVIRFRLYADLPPNQRGDHQFFYQNNHMPDIGVYLVNALSDEPKLVQITHQDRDVLQIKEIESLIKTCDRRSPTADRRNC